MLTYFPKQKSLQKQLEEVKDTYFQIIHLNINVLVCEPFSEFLKSLNCICTFYTFKFNIT